MVIQRSLLLLSLPLLGVSLAAAQQIQRTTTPAQPTSVEPFSATGNSPAFEKVPKSSVPQVSAATQASVFSTSQSDTPQLKGQYTFYLSGQETASSGATGLIGVVGSFYADGQGHITSGVYDKNSASGHIQAQNLIGTYHFDLGGKGSVALSSAAGAAGFTFYSSIPVSASNQTFSIVAGTGTLQSASGQLVNSYALPPFLNGNGVVTANFATQAAPGQPEDFGAAVLTFSPLSAGQVTAQGIATLNASAPQPFTTVSGNYTTPDPTTGRFTMTLPGLGGSSGSARNYVAYPAAGQYQFFFLSANPVPVSPLVLGSPAN